jgi:hypothetical protein
LPWDFEVSGVFQNLPGIPITASYAATNAEIRPTLGRNLGQCGTSATCTGTVTINNLDSGRAFVQVQGSGGLLRLRAQPSG